MSEERKLFDTVFLPTGQQTTEQHLDLIHIAAGWKIVTDDLEGSGRRWLFTPWLTTQNADLLGIVRQGDRLLIRGNAKDFLKGSSDLKAVKAFMEWGVEVRRMPTLHAKVYAREYEGSGVLWLGSANLSQRGEDGTPHSAQVEAMSGPHPLNQKSLNLLEYLWKNSKPFNPTDIQREIDRLAEEQAKLTELLVSHAPSGVLAVRLSFRLLTGQYSMTPASLGHSPTQAETNRVKYPSVEYVDPDNSQLAKQFQNFLRTERRKLNQLLEDVPGVRGLYVLRLEDMELVKSFLGDVEAQGRLRFEKQLSAERPHLRENFGTRFREAFKQFLSEKNRPVALTPEKATIDAQAAFDAYMSRDPFRVSAQFFVPLVNQDDPDDGLLQAMQQVRARQRIL